MPAEGTEKLGCAETCMCVLKSLLSYPKRLAPAPLCDRCVWDRAVFLGGSALRF